MGTSVSPALNQQSDAEQPVNEKNIKTENLF
jgi:hypothetical protein